MNITSDKERQKYLFQEILFADSEFKAALHELIWDRFGDLPKILSKTQLQKLKNKLREKRQKKSTASVDDILKYIKHQQDKDKAEKNWAKKIDNKPFGEYLKDTFEKFAREFPVKLKYKYFPENEILQEELSSYWIENQKEARYLLLEKYIGHFFLFEFYGKETYEQLTEGGKINWKRA